MVMTARGPGRIDALRQLGVLSPNELRHYHYSPTIIRNHRGDQVGEARSAFCFEIKRSR
jgi:hypothetical protein